MTAPDALGEGLFIAWALSADRAQLPEYRAQRKARGWTMGQMARYMGCSVARVSDIELGRVAPTIAEVEAYASVEIMARETSRTYCELDAVGHSHDCIAGHLDGDGCICGAEEDGP